MPDQTRPSVASSSVASSSVATSSVVRFPNPLATGSGLGLCTIPLKQHNFTLRASRAFNMARTLEQANLLESSVYGEQFFSWQNFHTCIGCGATAAWRAPAIWKFGTCNLEVRLQHCAHLDFSHIERFIFVSWHFLHQNWFNCTVSI